MIDRRDLLIGGICAVGLAGAEYLRPRELRTLFDGEKLDSIVPYSIGPWKAREGGEMVVPKTPGSLADRLYSDTVQRTYYNPETGDGLMLLIAYGRSQSDLLQLHRPESCYPAIGLDIKNRLFTDIPLGNGQQIPAVALTAQGGSRTEDIVYWTRLGEYLPRTAGEQREDRLKTAMAGYIGDGALVRASVLRSREAEPRYGLVSSFMRHMIEAMPSKDRKALVGTQRSA